MKKYQSFLGENRMIKDQGLLRHEDIRKRIKVLPELEELIPPLQKDEYEQLEANILREGCREALLVWEVGKEEESVNRGDYVLIDGHNRYGICSRHTLDFRIHLISFSGLPEVKEYMIDNQLGRRNLTPEQISYLRGRKYNAQKLDKGKYDRLGHKGQIDPYDSGMSTAGRLAGQFNVSEKTIKRDAAFAEGLDKLPAQERRDLLSGKVKMRKADIQALSRKEPPSGKVVDNQPQSRTIATEKAGKDDRQKLITKINTFSSQLAEGTGKIGHLCDQIMAAAQALKALEKTR